MTSILGIGTARARHVVDQPSLARRYQGLLAAVTGDQKVARRARLLFRSARVRSRQFAIPDMVELEKPMLYGGEELPSTSRRMEASGTPATSVSPGPKATMSCSSTATTTSRPMHSIRS